MHNTPRLLLRGCIRHAVKRCSPSRPVQRRHFNLLRKKSDPEPQQQPPASSQVVHPLEQNSKYLRLAQDNLFHPLISSPILSIRKRAMAIKSLALCPTSGLLEGNEFTCPNCGFPTHCSEEHYRLDQERHEKESCDTLRMINEDLHDMQSGRQFPEFTLRRMIPLCEGGLICRTTIHGLGSYTIYTVDGDDFFRTVIAAFNQCPVVSLYHCWRAS